MATYTLSVLTTSLGLGVIAGARVSMEKMRAVMSNSYPPTDNLYRIELPTNSNGLSEFPLEPDDSSTFHTAKVFDTAGVLVYQKRFSMPPQNLNLEDSAYDVVTSGSIIQFQGGGTNLGTPTTVRNVNFIGTNATLSNYTLTVEITPESVGADIAGSASTAEQSAKDYADDGLALKLDSSAYVQHFLGKYTSLGALQTAHATATDGDYAIVDTGSGSNAREYVWDLQEGWVDSGDIKVGTTSDQISEGSSNLYFTSARVLAVALTGLSLVTNAAITASDTVLAAFGKLQKQISDLISARRYTFNKYTSSTHTLLLAELTPEGSVFIQMNNASANTVYCPTPTSLGVTVGDSCYTQQFGAGVTSLAAVPSGGGSGATFTGDLVFTGQNKVKCLIADSPTSWLVVG
jgi:hypothetical protein